MSNSKHTSQQVVVALGSNQGASQTTLYQAVQEICQIEGVTLVKGSSLYRTRPWGYLDQPDFINACILLQVELELHQFYQKLARIELDFGRVRLFKNGPRTLDLDIIWTEHETLNDELLIVPHPRAHERAFVLIPLQEIAPELMLQNKNKSVTELAQALPDSELDGIVRLEDDPLSAYTAVLSRRSS